MITNEGLIAGYINEEIANNELKQAEQNDQLENQNNAKYMLKLAVKLN